MCDICRGGLATCVVIVVIGAVCAGVVFCFSCGAWFEEGGECRMGEGYLVVGGGGVRRVRRAGFT